MLLPASTVAEAIDLTSDGKRVIVLICNQRGLDVLVVWARRSLSLWPIPLDVDVCAESVVISDRGGTRFIVALHRFGTSTK